MPDRSHRPASRYASPRSPRNMAPRSTSEAIEHPPRPLRLAHPVVLRQEPQVADHLLAVVAPPVLLGRGPADVKDLRLGVEEHLPAGLDESVAPVALLVEHEEVLVEEPDGVGGVAPDEHRRAHHELGLADGVVIEPARVERVQRPGTRGELAQEEVLGREPPDRGKPAHRPLQRAVRIEQLRADDGSLRMLVGEGDQLLQRAVLQPGVRVQEQVVATRGGAHPGVRASSEPAVLLLDDPRGRKALANELQRSVGRAVVDDDHLGAGSLEALQRALDPGERVVGDDDGRDVHQVTFSRSRGGHAPPPRAGSPRRGSTGRS